MFGFPSSYEQLCASLPCFTLGEPRASKRGIDEPAPVVEMGFATYAGDRYGTLNQDWCIACQVRAPNHPYIRSRLALRAPC
jgi:hypothetical protein